MYGLAHVATHTSLSVMRTSRAGMPDTARLADVWTFGIPGVFSIACFVLVEVLVVLHGCQFVGVASSGAGHRVRCLYTDIAIVCARNSRGGPWRCNAHTARTNAPKRVVG